MNPDIAELEPSSNLPKPSSSAGELEAPPKPDTEKFSEKVGSKQLEVPTSSKAGIPVSGQIPAQLSSQPPPIAMPQASPIQVHVSDAPSDADDADLIEKEWVIKAKAIVEQTIDDPHAQKREISKFKADYMKKRYNKELKVSEE